MPQYVLITRGYRAITRYVELFSGDVQENMILDRSGPSAFEYISSRWHAAEDKDDIRLHLHRKDSLSVEDGCILRGHHVVIPPAGHEVVLDQPHSGHPGITQLISLA